MKAIIELIKNQLHIVETKELYELMSILEKEIHKRNVPDPEWVKTKARIEQWGK